MEHLERLQESRERAGYNLRRRKKIDCLQTRYDADNTSVIYYFDQHIDACRLVDSSLGLELERVGMVGSGSYWVTRVLRSATNLYLSTM